MVMLVVFGNWRELRRFAVNAVNCLRFLFDEGVPRSISIRRELLGRLKTVLEMLFVKHYVWTDIQSAMGYVS